jgi:hypothetical protein
MPSVKVYKYQWTYWDFLKDIEECCISDVCVTSKHIEKKADKHPGRNYAIIPNSMRTVERMQVVHGVYHPMPQAPLIDSLEHTLD